MAIVWGWIMEPGQSPPPTPTSVGLLQQSFLSCCIKCLILLPCVFLNFNLVENEFSNSCNYDYIKLMVVFFIVSSTFLECFRL